MKPDFGEVRGDIGIWLPLNNRKQLPVPCSWLKHVLGRLRSPPPVKPCSTSLYFMSWLFTKIHQLLGKFSWRRFQIFPPFCFCFDLPKLGHLTADLYQNSAHFVNKNPDFFLQIRTVWRSLFWVATTITTNWEGALFSAIQSNPVWFWHFLGHHIN